MILAISKIPLNLLGLAIKIIFPVKIQSQLLQAKIMFKSSIKSQFQMLGV